MGYLFYSVNVKEEAESIRKGNKNLSGKEKKKEEKLRSRIRRRL